MRVLKHPSNPNMANSKWLLLSGYFGNRNAKETSSTVVKKKIIIGKYDSITRQRGRI